MALTMTRARTQTALTKLAAMVANVHGELAFLQGLLARPGRLAERQREALHARRAALEGQRQALHLTLRQFDPSLDPDAIGTSDEWMKAHGRGEAALRRYLAKLEVGQ